MALGAHLLGEERPVGCRDRPPPVARGPLGEVGALSRRAFARRGGREPAEQSGDGLGRAGRLVRGDGGRVARRTRAARARSARSRTISSSVARVSCAPPRHPRARMPRAGGRARRGASSAASSRLPGGQHEGDEPAVEPARPRRLAGRPTLRRRRGPSSSRSSVRCRASSLVSASRCCWNVVVSVGEPLVQRGELARARRRRGRRRRASASRWQRSSRYALTRHRARARRASTWSTPIRANRRGSSRIASRWAASSGANSASSASIAVVRVGRARVLEHRQHAAEQRARALERHERVLERRRRGSRRDRLDLGALLAPCRARSPRGSARGGRARTAAARRAAGWARGTDCGRPSDHHSARVTDGCREP